MPKNKDLKRLVRARMDKTGESYTAARAHIVARDRGADPTTDEPTPEDYAELAGMADEKVAASTGRTWAEWVEILDAIGAASMPHRDIARWVADEHGVASWWTQTVTVGYERIRGLRQIGQRRDGTYEANKSKTYPVPVERLYDAFADDEQREAWLPGTRIEVRTCNRPKTVRWLWQDGTPVEAYFTARGPERSAVAIQHRQLASRADVDAAKEAWNERLRALAATLA